MGTPSRNDQSLKPKDLVGQPWRLAFALRDQGWWLRQDIIWHKPSAMPESVTDRCTRAHEYIFMFSKNGAKPIVWRHRRTNEWVFKRPDLTERISAPTQKKPDRTISIWEGFDYFYDAEAIRTPVKDPADNTPDDWDRANNGKRNADPKDARKVPSGWDTAKGAHTSIHREGRTDKQRGHSRRHAGFNDRWDEMERTEQVHNGANRRSVWTIASTGYPGAHFATFPRELAELCIRAGCPIGGLVCDIFGGSGTVAEAALLLNRNYLLMELNPKYVALQQERLAQYPILTAVNS